MSFADVLDILYEDNHCLALNKPAGWPTHALRRPGGDRRPARQGVPEGEVRQARQRLPRRRPPARQAGLRRAAVRPHQQGRRPAQRAVPRGDRREDLLGRRREPHVCAGRSRCRIPARSKTGCCSDDLAARTNVVPAGTPNAQSARLVYQVRGRARRPALARTAARTPAASTSSACSSPPAACRSTATRSTAKRTLRHGHRAARPEPDVPAPDDEGAGHGDRRGAADVARALRVPSGQRQRAATVRERFSRLPHGRGSSGRS